MWSTAYVSAEDVHAVILLIGVIICCGLTAATNLLNIYTDASEDAINLCDRAQMVTTIGFERVRNAAVICYLVPLLLAATFTSFAHFVMCCVGAINSITYSWGPRFKTRPFVSLAAISGVVVLPFVAGGFAARGFSPVNPIVLVFFLSFFSYCNLKNFPDAPGDLRAGVRTVFNSYSPIFIRRFVVLSMLSPYVLLLLLIVTKVLPLQFLSVLPLAIVPFLILRRIEMAKTTNDKELVHVIGFIYEAVSLAIMLMLYYWSTLSVVVLAALLLFAFAIESLGIDSRTYRTKLPQ
jgi:4-hydroxybenzoate polyprenyltransferase